MGGKDKAMTFSDSTSQHENQEPEERSLSERLKITFIKYLGYLFFIAVSVNFLEIIVRVVFNNSVDLFFDVPTWLNSWVMILASGIILLDNGHLSIDALRHSMGHNILLTKSLDLINNLLTLLFGVVLTVAGTLYVKQLYSFGTVISRSIDIPSWLVELCVPLGMGFFSICAVIKLIRDFRK